MKKPLVIIIIALCAAGCLIWYYAKNSKDEFNYILKPIADMQIASIPKPLNGSILPATGNQYWLAIRENINIYTSNYSTKLAIAILNQDFSVAKLQPIDLTEKHFFKKDYLNTAQDPRIFNLNHQTYIIFNDVSSKNKLRQMYIAELTHKSDKFTVNNLSLMHYNSDPDLVQKNWVPFEFNNKLYFIYSFAPYILLQWDQINQTLITQSEVASNIQKAWHYGVIRGGTPAIYVQELDGYLGFFHSSVELKSGEPSWSERKSPRWRKYYMGAYVIDAKPPFAIKSFTRKPLAYPGQYAQEQNYYVIFPAGLIERDDSFIISAGVDDSKTILLSVLKSDLYTALH